MGAYAAALTYSLLFALLPLGLALAALVPALHLAAAQSALLAPLAGVVPAEVVDLIRQFTAGAGATLTQAHGHRTLALASAGIFGYLWGMSGAFRRLIDAVNQAYEYLPPLRRSGWATLALALALAVTLGVGLVAAMVLATIGKHLVAVLAPGTAGAIWLTAVRWCILLALAAVILAVLYWVAPDRPRPFHWVTPGAVAALVVWLAVSYGFSLYLAHWNSYDAVYGGFGAGILLLLYLYFFSYALVLGAEINAVLEHGHDKGMLQG